MAYRFLAHEIFYRQLEEFIAVHTEAWNSLVTQLKKAVADPHRACKLMRVVTKKLQGRIFRCWVHGPMGYRLIYMVNDSRRVVLGIFVSMETKRTFDYDKVPWESYALDISDDLIKGNMSKFRELTLPD